MSDMSMRLSLQDDVSSKLSQVSSSVKSTSSELKSLGQQLDNAFKSTAPSQFASSLSNSMSSAEKDVDALGNALDSAFDALDSTDVDIDLGLDDAAKAADDFASSAQDAGDSINDFAETADDAGESVDDLASSAEDLGNNINDIDGSGSNLDNLASEADEAGASMESAEGKATSLTGTLEALFAAVSAAAVLDTITDFTNATIDLGETYTQTVSEVAAISGANAEDMAQLEASAREYGSTTIYSASEAAEALKYMSLAGWDATQSTEALGGVLNLAASAGMDLGEASDIVTDYLTAFGMEASQATELADAMSYAQANSNTSVSQLSEAYRNSAATMNASGQSVYTTTALLEAMANQGYKGSTAGTALAAVMRDITSSMEDGAIQIGDATVAVADQEGNFRDLTDILYDVEGAVDGLGSAERSTALSDTFTSRSLRAVNMVLEEGVENIYDYEDALRNAGGTAGEMADIMTDNLTGDKKMLSSAWQELELEAFEAIEDPLREVVQWLTAEVVPVLTDWIPDAFSAVADAASSIGDVIGPMITGILENPSGILNVLEALGGAFVAMKGVDLASSLGTKLSSWSQNLTIGNEFAMAAAAVTAAVILIKGAVDDYNALQISNNLEAHFGDIELDTSEVEALAGTIVPVDIIAQLQLAETYFDEADELVAEAEDLLAQNEKLSWRISTIQIDPEGDLASMLDNSDQFTEAVTGALEDKEYAAELTVKALLGNVESEELVSTMQDWFSTDLETIDTLGNAVTNMLEDSINSGADAVNVSTAVEIIQEKMLQMVNGVEQAQLRGSLEFLNMTYGNGAALSSDSWAAVVEQAQEYQQELIETSASEYESLFQTLEIYRSNDPTRSDDIDAIMGVIADAYSNLSTSSLSTTWESMYGGLAEAYSSELNTAEATLSETTADWIDYYQEEMQYAAESGDFGAWTYIQGAMGNVNSGLDSATKGALLDRYETLFPTVEELGDVIDNAAQAGEAVPQAIMDAYNQAMELGAAAGDTEAMNAYMGRMLAESYGSKDELMADMEAAGFTFEMFPEAMQEGINRAFMETSEDIDFDEFLSGIENSMSQGDWDEVERYLQEYAGGVFDDSLENIANEAGGDLGQIASAMQIEGLTETGRSQILDGGEISFEYEVNSGDTLSHIAEQAGIALDELIEANPQIENPDYIETGELIWVPQVDTSEAGEAIEELQDEVQEMADEATAEPIEAEQDVEETFTVSGEAGEAVDELRENAQEAADAATAEPIEAEQQVNETFTTGETDTSALEGSYEGSSTITLTQSNNADAVYSEVGEALVTAFSAPISVDGDAEVEIAETNNAAAVYSEVVSALQSAFAVSIPVSANASVTINYSLANPSATVDFGGAGSGSATVTATMHAEGGIFDTPHLGMIAEAGPEAIIPLNGSDDSLSLWEEAGKQLGFEYIEGSGSGSSGSEEKASGGGSSERTINIEINGNGAIQVQGGSGASKDEIVDVMMENLRDVFEQIVEEEILEEGDGTYEW